MRLTARLEIEQAKVEESMGKPIQALSRVEAKEWIKRLRDMAEEIGGTAPGSKVRFGQWPGSREDRETLYLARFRDSGTVFSFKLFNGEEFRGTIVDYTPYTITVRLDGQGEVVLRKLAIAYYRQAPEGAAQVVTAPEGTEAGAKAEPTPKASARKKSAEDQEASQEQHQPVDEGLDSDRAGEPGSPEADNMDEDRGM
jgi:sRNA-binding regulator protein Hfq